jgi:hypothetical protein
MITGNLESLGTKVTDMSDTPWYSKNYKEMMKSTGVILPIVQEQLLKLSQERNSHRDTDHLHPSELSKKDWCPRSAFYKIKGYPSSPESYTFSRLNVFEEGHAIHNKWQTWLWKAGVLSGNWSCKACDHYWNAVAPFSCPSCSSDAIVYREVPVHNDELRIIGHSDGEVVDGENRYLIEIKSVGLGTVRWDHPTLYKAYSNGELSLDGLWKNIKKPFASHVRQGQIYLHCTGLSEIIFIYEWKPTQEVKEFKVTYQEELVQPIIDNCKLVIEHLEKDEVPEKPYWASASTCNGCKFCPYKKECWK